MASASKAGHTPMPSTPTGAMEVRGVRSLSRGVVIPGPTPVVVYAVRSGGGRTLFADDSDCHPANPSPPISYQSRVTPLQDQVGRPNRGLHIGKNDRWDDAIGNC